MINIIMPIYNGSAYLDKALGSIALQSLPREEFKVTLVNDGGDETYEEYVTRWNKFIDVEEIYMKQNMGCGFARQVGIDNTEGEYYCFLDADDMFMHPDALKILKATIEEKEADVVVSNIWSEDNYNTVGENMIWMHGKLYRRKFTEEHHVKFCPVREATNGSEDIPYNEMIRMFGGKVYYIDTVTYYWRANKKSLTRREDFAITKFRSNLINRIWLYKNVELVDKPKAIDYILMVLCQCYHSYNEWVNDGRCGEEEFENIKMLYEDTIKGEDLCMSDYENKYREVARNAITFTSPPIMSYYEYLEKLGVYEQVFISKMEFDEDVKNFEERVGNLEKLPTEVEQSEPVKGEE